MKYYYMLSFHYPGPRVFMPADNDELSSKASQANVDADEKIKKRAKAAGLEMRGAYAWPDGSLYNYIRTTKETSIEDFKKALDGEDIIVLGADLKKQPQVLGPGIDVLTLEEKFAGLPREQHNALIKRRIAEREAFYADYRKARDECDTCKPGRAACNDCIKLCKAAEKAQDEWRKQLRPFSAKG